MNCWRHRDRIAVGVCTACGKGVCGGEALHDVGCARDDAVVGLHCGDACAVRRRRQLRAGDASVGWGWSILLVALGVALLYYGWHQTEWSLSVPNLLGMLFLWYGAVLLLQRFAQRRAPAP